MENNLQNHELKNLALDIALDSDGHLVDYTLWNEQIAQTLANTLNVVLTPVHYQILNQVRSFFVQYHHSPATRPLIKYLTQTLPSEEISNAKLQDLLQDCQNHQIVYNIQTIINRQGNYNLLTFFFLANFTAKSIAQSKLELFAKPVPAKSSAVPWSTDVRM